LPTLIVRILCRCIPDTDEHSPDAGQFKKAFEDARENNTKLASTTAATSAAAEDKPEEVAESKDEGEGEANAPAPGETNPPAAGAGEKTGEE